eukprot:TRINITY_DN2602_c0_g1_i2.p1 TRINITY_DN2602_c0_g1~~TRINITY_DN2602_c0_g1_i2.p1  ORF type:complete len:222 (-),score=50.59 TRINITY_DN2602_c0_g1_i2:38-703(-)
MRFISAFNGLSRFSLVQPRHTIIASPCLNDFTQKRWNQGPKHYFTFDTYKLVKRFEQDGFTTKQAEAITGTLVEIIGQSYSTFSAEFASTKALDGAIATAKSDVVLLKNDMDHTLAGYSSDIKRENERIKSEVAYLKTELKYEIERIQGNQKLDLNLERGRIQELLGAIDTKIVAIDKKMVQDINTIKTNMEALKYDIIKYCVGTIISTVAAGLAVLRILF